MNLQIAVDLVAAVVPGKSRENCKGIPPPTGFSVFKSSLVARESLQCQILQWQRKALPTSWQSRSSHLGHPPPCSHHLQAGLRGKDTSLISLGITRTATRNWLWILCWTQDRSTQNGRTGNLNLCSVKNKHLIGFFLISTQYKTNKCLSEALLLR